jgi:hypothetical protein
VNRHEIILLGEAAERALQDQGIMAALAAIEDEQVRVWKDSSPLRPDEREDAYRLTRCVGMIRTRLEAFVANAKVEKANAERESKPRADF